MRVLLATDGSKDAKTAAESLLRFPLPSGSTALVVCVAPTLAFANRPSSVELQRWLDERAKQAVEECGAAIRERFVSVESRLTNGDPREAIVRAAREWGADLIVLGARGLGAVATFLLGSVSVGVSRHAHCSVLVVKGAAELTRRIVLGIDGSESGEAAARWVAGLPLDSSTLVHLVAVVEPFRYPGSPPDFLEGAFGRDFTAAMTELRLSMEAAVQRAQQLFPAGVKLETTVTEGTPASELVQACTRANADLLVVGARGVGAFERLLLGSVSDAALRHSSCSVLVVRHS